MRFKYLNGFAAGLAIGLTVAIVFRSKWRSENDQRQQELDRQQKQDAHTQKVLDKFNRRYPGQQITGAGERYLLEMEGFVLDEQGNIIDYQDDEEE